MGLYEFCRMPFCVTGGPSSFQRLMDKVLRGLFFVTSYIDDILIHSNSMDLLSISSTTGVLSFGKGRFDIEGYEV